VALREEFSERAPAPSIEHVRLACVKKTVFGVSGSLGTGSRGKHLDHGVVGGTGATYSVALVEQAWTLWRAGSFGWFKWPLVIEFCRD